MKFKSFESAATVALLFASVSMTGCTTIADAKAGKGTGVSQTYAVAPARVWQVLPNAVKQVGLDYVADNKEEGYAVAQRGISAFSYGENVAIFVDAAPSQSTKVEVVSKRALATTIFATEWAKPILDKITELLR